MTKTQRRALEEALEKLLELGYAETSLSFRIYEALAEPAVPEGWASVAHSIPDVIVLASYTDFTGKQIVVRACYFKKHEQETNDEYNFDYDESSDTYYIPEGWYECISNWDDYSSVKIHGNVTHWMPLPAAPKKED